jgi:phage protein D
MPDIQRLLSQCYITLNGKGAPGEMMRDLEQATVETSLHLPDVATLALHDPQLRWLDDQRLAPGTPLRITMRSARKDMEVFDGEIVEIEPDFGSVAQRLVVRAFDRLHRLSRVRHVRAFQNVNDGDLIRQLADEVQLDAEVGPTRYIHPYIIQANVTNLALLQERAAMLGYLLYVQGGTLHCKPPETDAPPIGLAWGDNLVEFRPRLTTIGQVGRVVARGWDPSRKQPVLGEARHGRGAPQLRSRRGGGEVAQAAFPLPETEYLVADRPLRSQLAAEQLAQAMADRIEGRFIEAEGVCSGTPTVVAGARIEMRAVGERFSGIYFVTSAIHSYEAGGGYTTRFSISGLNSTTLMSLLLPEREAASGAGLVIGIVSDNDDPEGLGRVRVRYPWLSATCVSGWARVITPGGGGGRGLQFIPEVDDEVLVGFEQGDMNHPYVLGGLWNGSDAPARSGSISGNRVRQRVIRSRTGHTIMLDDSDDGGSITIEDSRGNKIALDTSSNALNITTQGDITLASDANISLEAKGKVSVKGLGVEIDGQNANVDVSGLVINLN